MHGGSHEGRAFLETSLYIHLFWGIVVTMTAAIDTNIWGFLAVPVGVVLCFGPALFVWIRSEYFSDSPDDRPDRS